MHRLSLGFLAVVVACPVLAGYAGRDLWVPVVGRTASADRTFFTTISITNLSGDPVDIALSYFPSAQPSQAPRSIALRIGPRLTRLYEFGSDLMTPDRPVGSLRIQADRLVTAEAHIYSRAPNTTAGADVGAAIQAIPAEFALGTGETTVLHGSTEESRYRLYTAETSGFPLYFSVTLQDDGGRETATRRYYVGPREQRVWDVPGRFVSLRIAGINGSGRIVALGTRIANESQDMTAYEMSLPEKPRHRMPRVELLAWMGAAVAVAAAGLAARKR